MEVLLDSHVALWWACEPELLTAPSASLIEDPLTEVWVSAASAWELAIEVATGKITVDVRRLFDGLQRSGIRLLGIGVDDGIDAGNLTWVHRDPFDRVLVAQARRGGFTILTRDVAMLAYDGVATIAS